MACSYMPSNGHITTRAVPLDSLEGRRMDGVQFCHELLNTVHVWPLLYDGLPLGLADSEK
jgi:hypothetical protein